jgi:hypothetical protein
MRAVHRHGRRKKKRLAGDFFLGLSNVGNDLLVRLARAGADAREREGRPHQLQETAASDGIEPLGGILWKFAVKEFLELGCLGERFETAPVLTASRRFEACPQSIEIVAFVHVRATHR